MNCKVATSNQIGEWDVSPLPLKKSSIPGLRYEIQCSGSDASGASLFSRWYIKQATVMTMITWSSGWLGSSSLRVAGEEAPEGRLQRALPVGQTSFMCSFCDIGRNVVDSVFHAY